MAPERQKRSVDLDLSPIGVQRRMLLDNLIDQPLDVDFLKRHLIASYPAITQNVLDQTIQTLGGAHDSVEKIRSLRPQLFPISGTEQLRKASHRAQWSSHVMRKAIRKGLQFADGFLEPGGAFHHCGLETTARRAEFILHLLSLCDIAHDFREPQQMPRFVEQWKRCPAPK